MSLKLGVQSLILALFLSYGCTQKDENITRTVEIKKTKDSFQLLRNGLPYYIKGAGGYQHFEKIKAHGGNSVRVWNTDNADSVLNEAHKYGLTVTLGLNIGSERHGFDYNNETEIKEQLKEIKKIVLKHKDHPALLMWGIGNELDINSARSKATNMKVWNAVNDIAKMIHKIDPNHPTTTMVVPYRKTIWQIKRRCPEIDILSINTFGELSGISSKLKEPVWGWNGPYIISEWGPSGWWEVDHTIWNAVIEATSSKKAEFYKERYEASMKKDKEKCLGSYVFYWGQKQERTHTWFSMFSESGHETASVDVMHYIWTEKWPDNKAPHLNYMLLNGKGAKDNIFVKSNEICTASIVYSDPEKDSLTISWEILPESTDLSGGGDLEIKPEAVPGLIVEDKGNEIIFNAPYKEGAYRIFVYIMDNKNHIAIANTPFYVIQ